MTIRITGLHKWLEQGQVLQSNGVSAALPGNPKESYTDRKAKIRILCGSIQFWGCIGRHTKTRYASRREYKGVPNF